MLHQPHAHTHALYIATPIGHRRGSWWLLDAIAKASDKCCKACSWKNIRSDELLSSLTLHVRVEYS